MKLEPVYHGILGIDIQGFARPGRDSLVLVRLRERLDRLLGRALKKAKIGRLLTEWSDRGDGVLLLTSTEVPPSRLLRLVAALATGLVADNEEAPPEERMRLRVVVHGGMVVHDRKGFTSVEVNNAARLLDAPVGRAILDGVRETDLVLLASERFFQDVVQRFPADVDPAGFQRVKVRSKDMAGFAWVRLPDRPLQPDLARLPGVKVRPPRGSGLRFGWLRVPARRVRWGMLTVSIGGVLGVTLAVVIVLFDVRGLPLRGSDRPGGVRPIPAATQPPAASRTTRPASATPGRKPTGSSRVE